MRIGTITISTRSEQGFDRYEKYDQKKLNKFKKLTLIFSNSSDVSVVY